MKNDINAFQQQIWKNNYKSSIDENIYDTFQRIAKTVSNVQNNEKLKQLLQLQFFNLMLQFKFVPGGRIIANAGVTENPKTTMYNCYVYHPYDFGERDIDSMQGIMQSLKRSGKILASQGGLGVNFSFIRPNGQFIHGIGNRTPGVIKFMQLWDKASQIITMGSSKDIEDQNSKKQKRRIRKGALMGVLDCSHGDILDFINAKQTSNRLTKFNLSVLIPDRFMLAVENDQMWKIGFPDTKCKQYKQLWDGNFQNWLAKGLPFNVSQQISAKQLWNKLMLSTYNRNQPGVLFYDTLNRYNPLSYCQTIVTTNPCLSGDTLIAVADERNMVKIKELALQNEDVQLYTMKDGLITFGKGRAFKSKNNAKTLKIILNDGAYFICTPNHKIMLKNGEYKQAKDLYPDDILMTNNQYHELNIKCIQKNENLDVYDITVPQTHNFAIIPSGIYHDQMGIKNKKVFVHNCGEIGMSSGVCNLGSINLVKYVKDGKFDFDDFQKGIKYAVMFLDNINQISYIPLQQYNQVIQNKRRIGLGVMGLGSMLAMLGIKFGSQQAIKLTDQIFKYKAQIQLLTSANLGKMKGSFKLFDREKYFNTYWWKTFPISQQVKEQIQRIGEMRNGTLSSVQPNGNSSILSGQVSNGIQPIYMKQYTRWVTMIDQEIKELKVKSPNPMIGQWYQTEIFKFALRGNQQILRGTINGKVYQIDKNRGMIKQVIVQDYGYRYLLQNNLPLDSIIQTTQLLVQDHVNMLSVSAKYIHQNQSKTVNIPNQYTFQQFKDVYINAWKRNIKGITTYRDGTMTAVLQKTKNQYNTQLQKLFSQNDIIYQDVPIPQTCYAMQYKIKDNKKKKWYFTLSFVDKKMQKPFALFIKTNTRQSREVADNVILKLQELLIQSGIKQQLIDTQKQKYKGQNNVDKIGRIIGMALRHNIPIVNIVNILQSLNGEISTLLFHIKRILQLYIKDGTIIQNIKCESCGSQNMAFQSGCKTCLDCGCSLCG